MQPTLNTGSFSIYVKHFPINHATSNEVINLSGSSAISNIIRRTSWHVCLIHDYSLFRGPWPEISAIVFDSLGINYDIILRGSRC
jgi:hypothetical protein